jgi:hypothetical protein
MASSRIPPCGPVMGLFGLITIIGWGFITSSFKGMRHFGQRSRSNEASKRRRSIPGIGLVGASAIVATVQDPKAFRSGRDFAAWIGLVPRLAVMVCGTPR